MTLIAAIILGIVEGLTEFLPISSTAHLTVVSKMLGYDIQDPGITAFTAVIQVGAIIAVIIYFWSDIARLFVAWIRGLFNKAHRQEPDYRMAWLVVIGSLPIALVGFALRHFISDQLRSIWIIAFALILWGIVMLYAEAVAKQDRPEAQLNLVDVLLIGFGQCLALIPGVSRSGATISIGLIRGLDRVAATRLSFLLGIPALIGAGAFELPSALKTQVATADHPHPVHVGLAPTLLATVVAFAVAYVSVAWLLKFVSGHSIANFVWYRWVVGVALIIVLFAGGLK
ncbi:Undecaprenyl-diphosphatase [Nakamurella panacisegetis]|uniref:Undecaprenyl-diphosphatase n=1 Tax=Nakamurella panacisegetis TaxID=1090615 RepID=A0A1H0S214_9ACTN|nr:undecaprenyl-diphosphate phosphatase [Nakamurella panacisegetis]SDP35667.1 Undecaprenyl-diphosphatase [Nakamurella panacisegetis]